MRQQKGKNYRVSNRFKVVVYIPGEITLGNLFAVGVRKSFQTFGCIWHRAAQVGLLHSDCMSKEDSLQASTCALGTGDFLERKPSQVLRGATGLLQLGCPAAGWQPSEPHRAQGLEEGSNLNGLQTAMGFRSRIYFQTTLSPPLSV